MLSERYEAVIGLEAAQTDPVVLGMPGVLPTLNRYALELAIRAGLATSCRINPVSRFARKHYFYPDLPKGYQISQFDEPLCQAGRITIEVEGKPKAIRLNRIHMEEDAGKLIHSEGFIREGKSYVDLNRAGTPLIEIVSEPDLSSAEEVNAYLRALRRILRYIGASDADMEKGHFRCDANVSIRPRGESKLGTRTEIKNVNSFRNVMRAIEYELDRHEAVIVDGGAVVQETRLWDPNRNVTRSMRSKEESPDYRYMPEPDLLPVEAPAAWVEAIRAAMPELPQARRARFISQHGLGADDADLLTEERTLADYFEAVVAEGVEGKKAANWINADLTRLLNDKGISIEASPLPPNRLGRMIKLVETGAISGKIGKVVLTEMFNSGKEPEAIIEEKGLKPVSDTGELEAIMDRLIAAEPDKVAEYRSGKEKLFGYFVGQVMKASQGKADPKTANELLKKKLSG